MNADNQQKLVNYVKNGGKLIISPLLPTKDINHMIVQFLLMN